MSEAIAPQPAAPPNTPGATGANTPTAAPASAADAFAAVLAASVASAESPPANSPPGQVPLPAQGQGSARTAPAEGATAGGDSSGNEIEAPKENEPVALAPGLDGSPTAVLTALVQAAFAPAAANAPAATAPANVPGEAAAATQAQNTVSPANGGVQPEPQTAGSGNVPQTPAPLPPQANDTSSTEPAGNVTQTQTPAPLPPQANDPSSTQAVGNVPQPPVDDQPTPAPTNTVTPPPPDQPAPPQPSATHVGAPPHVHPGPPQPSQDAGNTPSGPAVLPPQGGNGDPAAGGGQPNGAGGEGNGQPRQDRNGPSREPVQRVGDTPAAVQPQPQQPVVRAIPPNEVGRTERPVRLHELAAAANTAIGVTARDGKTNAHISLEPEHLGRVEIHLTYEAGGGVTANVTADSSAAASVLTNASGDLRRTLEAQGFTVLGLDVRQGGLDLGNTSDRNGAGTGGNAPTEPVAAPDEPTATTTIEATSLPLDGVQVDVLA